MKTIPPVIVSGPPDEIEAMMAAALAEADAGAEPALPGLLMQARNLAVATAEHIAAGMPESPPELVAARLAACEACDRFRASDRRCGGNGGCGCFVEIKATWLDQGCPLGRWPVAATIAG